MRTGSNMKRRRMISSGACGHVTLLLLMFMGVAVPSRAMEPSVVRLWNWNVHDKKYQQKMYKLFNERHPDIKIEYSSISNTVYAQTLEAAFIANDPPDLFLPTGKMTFNYLKDRGLISPLNSVAPSANELQRWMDQYPAYLRKFVEGVSVFDGKVYYVDTGGESGDIGFPLYWNKTLFKEAGIGKPPSTQRELRQLAAKITQAGAGKYFGIVHGLRYPGAWGMELEGSLAFAAGVVQRLGPPGGPAWFPDLRDGRFHFSSPEYKKAMNVWISMRGDGSVYPGIETMEDEQAKMAFATNKAALIFGGSWNVANHLAYNPDADFDLVPPPTPDDGIRRGYFYANPIGGSWGYLVSGATRHPEAVWEVIRFITSLEFQEGWVKGGYGISYLPQANRPENFAVPQMYRFVEWANDPTWRRIPPVLSTDAQKIYDHWPGIYPTHVDTQTNVYLGKSDLEALDDLDRRCDAAFDVALAKAQEAGLKLSRSDFSFPDWDPSRNYVQKKK